MTDNILVAVLSGDLVKSRTLEEKRQDALDGMRKAVEAARVFLRKKGCQLIFSGFYRGDAFQCALSNPRQALWTAVFLRAELVSLRGAGIRVDTRIGVGLGAVSAWDENNIAASDGEAFQLSGKALDSLKSAKEKYRRLLVLSTASVQNDLFSAIASLLDAIIQRWTPEQAAAIALLLREKAQEDISKALGISQPAVQTRLQTAGHFAVREALQLFPRLIDGLIIKPGVDNAGL